MINCGIKFILSKFSKLKKFLSPSFACLLALNILCFNASAKIEQWTFDDGSSITRFQREDLQTMLDIYGDLVKDESQKIDKEFSRKNAQERSKDKTIAGFKYAASSIPLLGGISCCIYSIGRIANSTMKYLVPTPKKPYSKKTPANKKPTAKDFLVSTGVGVGGIFLSGLGITCMLNTDKNLKENECSRQHKKKAIPDSKEAYNLLLREKNFIDYVMKYGKQDLSEDCACSPNLTNFFNKIAITREELQKSSDYCILELKKGKRAYLHSQHTYEEFDDECEEDRKYRELYEDNNYDKLLNHLICKFEYDGLNLTHDKKYPCIVARE